MVNAKDVLYKMKVCELNNIMNMFELNCVCRKKENITNIVYGYMKENMSSILNEVIIYEEIDLLRRICENNFKCIYNDEKINSEYVNSLSSMGILYINEKENCIGIPEEYQMQIKSCLGDKCLDECSKKKTEIIRMVNYMLEIYGVFDLELLEDYITEKIGVGYRVHKAIKVIRKYNLRNKFFYEDEECFFYNLKVNDMKSMKMRVLDIDLSYKYFSELEMAEILNRESAYEKDVKIILNRVFKNLKTSEDIVKAIRSMIIEGKSSDEIGMYLKEKVKRLSEFGYKSILKSVENMENDHIIWGHKGYYLEELDEEMMA